jgi:hypothetical protein
VQAKRHTVRVQVDNSAAKEPDRDAFAKQTQTPVSLSLADGLMYLTVDGF